ncbi:MAG: hypothetical protein D6681_02335 [Calditrichaeota bacterium]|nr:MAG: hypothetical protein D6681_02335 [Calditrichota bacterium]
MIGMDLQEKLYDDKLYVVIIGDMSGSKQLSGRSRYQAQLFIKSAIVQINEEYAEHIEAPFTITKGDEFQGLLTDLEAAFRIVLALEKLTFPVRLRFGLGVGEVLKMGSHTPIEMDGPAFHRANAALNMAKKKKCNYYIITPDENINLLINTTFHLITAIKQRWKERHYRLYWRYKDLGTYREVGALENITPQAVCDALKNSRAISVKTAEENLLEYFQQVPLCRFQEDSSDQVILGDDEYSVG